MCVGWCSVSVLGGEWAWDSWPCGLAYASSLARCTVVRLGGYVLCRILWTRFGMNWLVIL